MVLYHSLTSRLMVSSLLVMVAACSDVPATAVQAHAEPSASKVPYRSVSGPPSRTIDDDFADLVDQIPGFGGVFVDSSGVVNIYAADVSSPNTARGAVAEFARRHRMNGLDLATRRDVRMRKAAFDYRELVTWRRALLQEVGTTSVTSLDIDERVNRIVIGVANDDAARDVARLAQELAIPNRAVTTVIEAPTVLFTTLRDSTNRVAGLAINRGYGFTGSCTMGPLVFFSSTTTYAVDSSMAYFVTNSHCSEELFALDGGWIGQPDISLPIGYEVADPPTYTHDAIPYCPAVFLNLPAHCRQSDASLYYLTLASTPFWHGTIAATPGDYNLNITDSWAIVRNPDYPDVIADYPYVGQTIHKTGQKTGSTSGTVQNTCVHRLHSNTSNAESYVLLCQATATLRIGPGDSGSPIVANATGYPQVHNPMTLVGLLWGGPKNDGSDQTTAYFSPWPNVMAELGGNMVTWH